MTRFGDANRAGDPAFFALHGSAIAAQGYHPFPIPPRAKATYWEGWSAWCAVAPTPAKIARWSERQSRYGIALACGFTCIAIDLDEENAGPASEVHALATVFLGETPLVRFGRAPRRVLLYQTANAPIASQRIAPTVELIGNGRYVLAHGLHPITGEPYRWLGPGPEDVPVTDLPSIGADAIESFAAAVRAYYGLPTSKSVQPPTLKHTKSVDKSVAQWMGTSVRPRSCPDLHQTLGMDGRLTDGRENELFRQVYRAWADGCSGPEAIADMAWARFSKAVDLSRPKRNGNRHWTWTDAFVKAKALLARGKPRPVQRITPANPKGFWTPDLLHTFKQIINEQGAQGRLPPSTVSVSHLMAAHVRGDGSCYASPATLATKLGLSLRTVKSARQRLVSNDLWQVTNNRGGRARGADYRPNPATLQLADNVHGLAPCAAKGEQSLHSNIPVVGGEGSEEGTGRIPLLPEKVNGDPLGAPGSDKTSSKSRTFRRGSAAYDVAEVPQGGDAVVAAHCRRSS